MRPVGRTTATASARCRDPTPCVGVRGGSACRWLTSDNARACPNAQETIGLASLLVNRRIGERAQAANPQPPLDLYGGTLVGAIGNQAGCATHKQTSSVTSPGADHFGYFHHYPACRTAARPGPSPRPSAHSANDGDVGTGPPPCAYPLTSHAPKADCAGARSGSRVIHLGTTRKQPGRGIPAGLFVRLHREAVRWNLRPLSSPRRLRSRRSRRRTGPAHRRAPAARELRWAAGAPGGTGACRYLPGSASR